jgi:hypothetical protein
MRNNNCFNSSSVRGRLILPEEAALISQCKIRLDKPDIHQPLARLRIEYHLQNPLAHGRSLGFTPSYFLIIWLRGL